MSEGGGTNVVGTVGTVAAIDGVKERVVKSEIWGVQAGLVDFVVLIVSLEKNCALRPDQWPRGHEVQVTLHPYFILAKPSRLGGAHGTVDQPLNGVGAIGNIRIQSAEEDVQIVLTIVVVEGLEDAQLVPGACQCVVGDAVLRPHALCRDVEVAVLRSQKGCGEVGNGGLGRAPGATERAQVMVGGPEATLDGLPFLVLFLELLQLTRVFSQFDARGDVIHMLLDILRQMIFFHANVLAAGPRALEDVEIGKQQVLDFLGVCIKLDPLLVG